MIVPFDKFRLYRDRSLHASGDGTLCITANTGLRILPLKPLGPSFVAGWYKLPPELKMEVLSHELILDHELSHYQDYELSRCQNYFISHMLPFLRISPETATLTQTVFYENNTFRLSSGIYITQEYKHFHTFAYPKPSINNLISRISFIMNEMNYGIDYDIPFLSKIANGEYGFRNLKEITVRIGSTLSNLCRRELGRCFREKVEFGCSGGVELIGYMPSYSRFPSRIRRLGLEVNKEEMERIFKEWIVFGVEKETGAKRKRRE
jgi:hypothetical protein